MKVGARGVLLGCVDRSRREDPRELALRLSRSLGEQACAVASGSLAVAIGDPSGAPEVPLMVVDGDLRVGDERPDPASIWTDYRRRGPEALSTLRGDYVLLLWDEREDRGLLARDPLGLRPLFLCEAGERLFFSTELEPLLTALPSRPQPDEVFLAHWLGYRNVDEPRTFYQGVRRLPGGHLLELGRGGSEARRFWSWPEEPLLEGPGSELIARLVEEIDLATRRSLRGAGTPGLLLSGGLDSATVLASATAGGAPGPLAYSGIFPCHPEVDESRLIDLQVASRSLRARCLEVRGGSVLRGALEYLSSWGVPNPDTNGFWTSTLRERIAADGVDVLLDGEGGDELFDTSYYLLADELRRGRVRSVAGLLRSIPGIAPLLPAPRLRARLLLRFGILGLPSRRPGRRWLALAGDLEEPPPYLSDRARRLIDKHDRGDTWRQRAGPRWRSYLLDSIACGGETIGAAEHLQRLQRPWGLVGRHPLHDLDLVRFVLRLPPALGFDPVYTRVTQRAALSGRAPEEVRLRVEKSFFNGLRTESMRGGDRRAVTALLLAPDSLVRSYVRPEAIEEMLRDPPSAPAAADRWAAHLLHLVTTECWLREQAEPGFAQETLVREPLEQPRLHWREAPA